MKKYLSLSILALCISSLYAKTPEQEFVTNLPSIINHVEQYQTEIWPRFHLNLKPIIIVYWDNDFIYHYAFNFKPLNRIWKEQIINGTTVFYFTAAKDVYNLSEIPLGFRKIDGQKSFIFNLNYFTEIPQEKLALFVRARFYYYEHYNNESNFPLIDIENADLEFNGMHQLMQVKLSYLEIEALKQYLLTQDLTQKENHLKNAVAINQYRTKLLDTLSRDYENFTARHYSLPYYVGEKALNLYQDKKHLDSIFKICEFNPASAISYHDISECIEYSFYDILTLAYGLSLDDKLNYRWKSETDETTPAQLIQRYYQFSDAEVTARVNNLIEHHEYNYKQIEHVLDLNLRPYIEKAAQAQEKYKALPGVEVQAYSVPDYKNFSVNKIKHSAKKFNQDEIYYYINNQVVLYEGAYADFREMDITGTQWIGFYYDNIPYLYRSERVINSENYWDKFKVLPETKLIIDGKPTTVSDFVNSKQHAHFKNLLLENNQVKIEAQNMMGEIDTQEGRLVIKTNFKSSKLFR